VFASFVSHCSSAFFRVMLLIDLETQLNSFYIPGFLPEFLHQFFYTLTADLGQVDRCLILKGDLSGRLPICRSSSGFKGARRFIGFYLRVNIDSG
jgi:hypothetical protein